MRRWVAVALVAGLLAGSSLPAPAAVEPDSTAPSLVPVEGLPSSDVPLPEETPPEAPAEEAPAVEAAPAPDLRTSWGFGWRENLYNEAIVEAVSTLWPHAGVSLPPALFKAIVATESSFNPEAVSPTGAAGLVQLTPDTARRFGLSGADRRDPEASVSTGVLVLAEKTLALVDPANYHKLLGRQPEDCPYALAVAEAYEELGPPTEEQMWPLMLAAYNGGGGTVLRAQAVAWKRGLDPRVWENLVGDRSRPKDSPLFQACVQVYGWGARGKYGEMVHYPEKVLGLYRETR